ncbi:hypothetical protein C7M84_016065 [Penaeus vannamei]|uniref:Uncharacterized protein n=1 Tax=Penaeus vannamei TaxID=6689 RepID=A0A3R7MN53_PENVA|nr:hypothetical protein C7M84_016065 [Penaeus vannamei]
MPAPAGHIHTAASSAFGRPHPFVPRRRHPHPLAIHIPPLASASSLPQWQPSQSRWRFIPVLGRLIPSSPVDPHPWAIIPILSWRRAHPLFPPWHPAEPRCHHAPPLGPPHPPSHGAPRIRLAHSHSIPVPWSALHRLPPWQYPRDPAGHLQHSRSPWPRLILSPVAARNYPGCHIIPSPGPPAHPSSPVAPASRWPFHPPLSRLISPPWHPHPAWPSSPPPLARLIPPRGTRIPLGQFIHSLPLHRPSSSPWHPARWPFIRPLARPHPPSPVAPASRCHSIRPPLLAASSLFPRGTRIPLAHSYPLPLGPPHPPSPWHPSHPAGHSSPPPWPASSLFPRGTRVPLGIIPSLGPPHPSSPWHPHPAGHFIPLPWPGLIPLPPWHPQSRWPFIPSPWPASSPFPRGTRIPLAIHPLPLAASSLFPRGNPHTRWPFIPIPLARLIPSSPRGTPIPLALHPLSLARPHPPSPWPPASRWPFIPLPLARLIPLPPWHTRIPLAIHSPPLGPSIPRCHFIPPLARLIPLPPWHPAFRWQFFLYEVNFILMPLVPPFKPRPSRPALWPSILWPRPSPEPPIQPTPPPPSRWPSQQSLLAQPGLFPPSLLSRSAPRTPASRWPPMRFPASGEAPVLSPSRPAARNTTDRRITASQELTF